MSANDGNAAMPTAAPAPERSLGETLRAARLAQEVTIEQLAAELRIEVKQLVALEDDRFEQIGVPVFVKGYIKQYAHRFGLSVADLLALYYQQGKLADVELKPNRTIKLRDERQISHWIVAGLVLATIGVGLAAWWWNGGSFDPARFRPAALSTSPTESAPSAPAPVEAAPAALEPPSAAPAGVPPAEPESGPAVGGEPPLPEPATADQLPAAGLVSLEFAFGRESWAEVTDARGERLLYGLSAAGRRVTVRGEPPVAVVLGNAEAVELRVDGESYPIPRTGRQGNLARFDVDIAED